MSALTRLRSGVRTVLTDPVGRRAYVGRAKWLLRGSGALPAHSLEYRAGLTGTWAIPAQRSDRSEEITVRCPEECGAHAPLAHLYEPRYVYRLRRTIASTASGATVMCGSTEPPFFVRESITWPFESIVSHGLEIPEHKDAQPPRGGTSVVFPTTANYYHWLIEDLPTVLRAAQVAPDADYLAFVDGVTVRHLVVADALSLRLVPAPVTVALDEQVLAGRASDSWFVHPEDARLLYDFGRRLTSDAEVPGTDRIYVSRRGTSRSLAAEEQLEAELGRRGFLVVRLEDLDWAEQIRLFQGARTVVAPHGAGLSNLVFTPPGASLVEITFGLHYNRCFEWLCHVSGHAYSMIDGDGTTASLVDRVTRLLP